MTWLAGIVAGLIALPLVYFGWRRGATRMVLDWIVLALLGGALWCYLQSSPWLAGGLAGAAFVVVLVRCYCYFMQEEHPPASNWRHRLIRYGNGSLGAAIGVVSAALICIAVALLGASLTQKNKLARVVKSGETGAPPEQEASPVVTHIADACQALANISNRGVLQHLPYLDEYGREVAATVEILNADEAQMRWLYHRHAMGSLVDTETLTRAMDDKAYVDLLSAAARGNPAAIRELKTHPMTQEILGAPRVQEFVKTTRPSTLLAELDEWPGPEAASQPASQPAWPPTTQPSSPPQ